VYWFQTNKESYNQAMRLHTGLLKEVASKNFISVFSGVDDQILPGLNASNIPPNNTHPIGPHPCGSFEVVTPPPQGNCDKLIF